MSVTTEERKVRLAQTLMRDTDTFCVYIKEVAPEIGDQVCAELYATGKTPMDLIVDALRFRYLIMTVTLAKVDIVTFLAMREAMDVLDSIAIRKFLAGMEASRGLWEQFTNFMQVYGNIYQSVENAVIQSEQIKLLRKAVQTTERMLKQFEKTAEEAKKLSQIPVKGIKFEAVRNERT